MTVVRDCSMMALSTPKSLSRRLPPGTSIALWLGLSAVLWAVLFMVLGALA